MKTWEEFKQGDCQISTDSVQIDKRLYEEIQREATAPLEQKLSKLSRMIELAGKANDSQSENEIACSASFAEAMAYQNSELLVEENDLLKRQLEQSQKACAEMRGVLENVPCTCFVNSIDECKRCKALSSTAGQNEGPSKSQ